MTETVENPVYSKRVHAGKRTYFFDVRSTRDKDYFLILTESRRQANGLVAGQEKSKVFLYKEDFEKFIDALQETISYIKTELLPKSDLEIKRQETDVPELDRPVTIAE